MKILFLLIFIPFWGTPEPLVCDSKSPSGFIKLNPDMGCHVEPKVNEVGLLQGPVQIYVKNKFEKAIDAILCRVKVHQTDTWGRIFKVMSDGISTDQWTEAVASGDCFGAYSTLRSRQFGHLEKQGEFVISHPQLTTSGDKGHSPFSAGNVLRETVRQFSAFPTSIGVQANGKILSSVGSTAGCQGYNSGSCLLEDNSTLAWAVDRDAALKYVLVRNVTGILSNNTLHTEDGSILLSNIQETLESVNVKVHEGIHQMLPVFSSDQGLYFTYAKHQMFAATLKSVEDRKKRVREHLDKTMASSNGPFGYIYANPRPRKRSVGMMIPETVSAYVASVLDVYNGGVEEQLREVINGFCDRFERLAEIAIATGAGAATQLAREILKREDIVADMAESFLAIYPCRPVEVKSFEKRTVCTDQIPVKFTDKGANMTGFLDPKTNQITPYFRLQPCDTIKPTFFIWKQRPHLYIPETGAVHDQKADVHQFTEHLTRIGGIDIQFRLPEAVGIDPDVFIGSHKRSLDKYNLDMTDRAFLREVSQLSRSAGNSDEPVGFAKGLFKAGLMGALFSWDPFTLIVWITVIYVWAPLVLRFVLLDPHFQALFIGQNNQPRFSVPYAAWMIRDSVQAVGRKFRSPPLQLDQGFEHEDHYPMQQRPISRFSETAFHAYPSCPSYEENLLKKE